MTRPKKSTSSSGVLKPAFCPDIMCSARPAKRADPGSRGSRNWTTKTQFGEFFGDGSGFTIASSRLFLSPLPLLPFSTRLE